jgi:hypothetical protein
MIWVPISMKTTIDIADELFAEIQDLARQEKTTFRSLVEDGLRLVAVQKREKPKKVPPIFTVPGRLSDDFKNASWDDIMEEIHPLPKL